MVFCCFGIARRQQNLSKNAVFLGFQTTRFFFWAWFWNELALQLVLQRHGVSPPGGDFFEAVLLLAAAGNRICRNFSVLLPWWSHSSQYRTRSRRQQNLSKNILFLGFQTTR